MATIADKHSYPQGDSGHERGRRSFWGEAVWSVLGNVASRMSLLVTGVVVARLLGKEGYGQFSMVYSTVGTFQVFAGLGLTTIVNKLVAQYRDVDPGRAGRVIVFAAVVAGGAGLFFAAAVVWGADVLATKMLASAEVGPLLKLAAVIVFISAVNSVQNGAMVGLGAVKELARCNCLVGLVGVPGVALGVWLGGLRGAVLALAASLFMDLIIKNRQLHRIAAELGVVFAQTRWWSEKQEFLSFGVPNTLFWMLPLPVTWLSYSVLVNGPDGYGELAFYNASHQWRTVILFIPMALGGLVISTLSNLIGSGHGEGHRAWSRRITQVHVLVTLLPALLVAGLSGLIMALYGEEFSGAGPVLAGSAAVAVVISYTNVVSYVLTSRGQMWGALCCGLVWAGVLLGCGWLWQGEGAMGLVQANGLAYLVFGLLLTLLLRAYAKDGELT